MADVVLINKVGATNANRIAEVERSTAELNPGATILRADSVVELDHPEVVAGKAVLVVEDGPTLTHGGMKFGAGVVAARQAGASEIVDPRPYVTGTIAEVFWKYDVGPVLPAEGYSDAQLGELEQAIAATPCEALVIGTPMDLRHLIRLTKPVARATYRLQELDGSGLTEVLERFIARTNSVSVG
jgi:predicted GTPase